MFISMTELEPVYISKDDMLPSYKCKKCGGFCNNPYPYCPWCGKPNKNSMVFKKEES